MILMYWEIGRIILARQDAEGWPSRFDHYPFDRRIPAGS